MKTRKLFLILIALHIVLPLMAQNDSAYWNNRFLQLLRWTYVDTSLSNLYLAPDTTEPIQEAALPREPVPDCARPGLFLSGAPRSRLLL